MTDFYDRQGKRIPLLEWARLLEIESYRVVAYSEFPGGRRVSTIWEGFRSVEQEIAEDPGPPLIFDTGADLGAGWRQMGRWPTEASALAAHDRICAEARDDIAELDALKADLDEMFSDLFNPKAEE